ncbi:HAD-IC family P-type ATPase [Methylocystis rosea]|uniref:Efflux RND transporter periplasmic adaptor subunit n=1 Tax=Methylocystis rosea TaxID=173366 RepID=A0A3G8MAA2_9HYPH|nr:HAD-IC family P-type ATPase [Methylocystis rosea]AZG78821.1 efflux RND transporter periplasmic adaptor subunit [Methylocystis rosea]
MENSPEYKGTWAVASDKVLQQFETTSAGLSEAEAARRLAVRGPNRLAARKRRSALLRFALQFHNVLIYVLLAAGVVTALMAHWLDSAVIIAVVVINAVIGFIQEGKAEEAMEAVRNMLSLHATVIRDGKRVVIDADDLVPGDIVYVQSGDKVPADIRLIRVKSLQVQEAALTGESLPVDKTTEAVASDALLGDRTSMAYSSTVVTYGQGTGVVVATGAATEIGRISELLSEVQTLTTPLLQRMDEFARWLTIVILAICVLVMAFGSLVWGFDLGEMFMAAVGLAVSAIPEGLPAIITITLAIGVERMARRNAIIRQLPAVETLGAVMTICSDKTGTLTRNELTVRSIVTAKAVYEATGTGYDPHGGFTRNGEEVVLRDDCDLMAVLRPAALCNDAVLHERDGVWSVDGDPTEGALRTAAVKGGVSLRDLALTLPRTDEIPFESQHRFMATLHHDHEGAGHIFVKGAPERLLDMCFWEHGDGEGQRQLALDRWLACIDEMAAKGQRVLAVASKPAAKGQEQLAFGDVESGLTFIGLIGLIDPPRPEAIEAIRECAAAGVAVKMITGDHAATAEAIARELGLKNPEAVLTGRDLDSIADEELGAVAQRTTVFARTSPEHKLRLVQSLQSRGEIIAMTGDGVNDAPALKRADIGIAMGVKGTEAAKEAAEIVLADDNFASIVHAVKEGRVVYENLKKTILYILPTNGGEGLTVMAAIAMGEALPVTPVQILWVNLITAVTLGLALAFEPPSPGIMSRLPRPSGEPILSRYFVWRIVFVSFLMLGATFGLYELEKARGMGLDSARTVAVNTLVACEVAYLFNARFLSESSLSLKGFFGSSAVLISIGIVVALQAMFTYVPFMHSLFHTTPLDAEIWGHIAFASALLFLLVEIEKAIFRSPAAQAWVSGLGPAAPAPRVAAVVAPGAWRQPVLAGILGLMIIGASGAIYFHTRANLVRDEARLPRGAIARVVVATGVIAPISQASVLASAAGVIASLRCAPGDRVTKGEICATLDQRPFEEAIARERKALAAAETQWMQRIAARDEAQAAFERRERASQRRTAARKAVQMAQRALERAKAQVERAESFVAERRAALEKAETARAGAEIAAPLDGFIIERRAAAGQRVAAGAPLFVVGDASTIRLRATASGDGALALAPGAEATLTSAAVPDRAFPGRVIEVRRPTAPEQGDATVDVVIEADNPDLALRPGMEASARIEIIEGEATLRAPNAALRYGERPPRGQELVRRAASERPRS